MPSFLLYQYVLWFQHGKLPCCFLLILQKKYGISQLHRSSSVALRRLALKCLPLDFPPRLLIRRKCKVHDPYGVRGYHATKEEILMINIVIDFRYLIAFIAISALIKVILNDTNWTNLMKENR